MITLELPIKGPWRLHSDWNGTTNLSLSAVDEVLLALEDLQGCKGQRQEFWYQRHCLLINTVNHRVSHGGSDDLPDIMEELAFINTLPSERKRQ